MMTDLDFALDSIRAWEVGWEDEGWMYLLIL